MFDYQRVLSKVKALKNLMVHDGSVILPIWHNGKVIYPKLGNLKKYIPVICYIAIDHGHLFIVSFPMKNGDFP